jgi:RHS repeat-associated protein
MGRVVESQRPDGTEVRAEFDRLGSLAMATDALGHVTRLEHGGTGHLARMVRADGQVYRFKYDSDERLIQILNPRLEAYEFDYDRADQIVAERTFDNRLITYRYNAAGRVVRIDHPEQEWRELSHDKLGNVLEDRGEDVQIVFTRDALGRVEKALCQDVTGKVVTEIERDGLGRLTADVQNGRAVRYEYDAEGRRSARILPDGERTEYHYDGQDAFVGITHDGQQIAIDRDALGRERARRARGWQLDSEYDSMDRLQSQRVTAPEAGSGVPRVLAERRYSYDAKGRLTSIDSLHGGMTVYRYDRIDQLVEASVGAVREVFEYDPTGSLVNMLGDLGDGGKKPVWSLAPGNQLRATGSAKYVNDARGRRIQRVARVDGKDLRENGPPGDERVTTYGWDSKDRLREVVTPEGLRVRFTYDAFGRRIRKDVLPLPRPSFAVVAAESAIIQADVRKSVHFLWDADVLCEEQDSGKTELERKRIHVHVPGTFVPLAQVERGVMFGVVNDHLGTPKELVDGSGRVARRATHRGWGGLLGFAGDQGAAEMESPFRFPGQYADEETGLCYTRFRYFEACTGRWLSPDPLGPFGGDNAFSPGVAPTMGCDPWGLMDARSRGYPYGTSSYGQFNQYGEATRAGLSSAGYPGTTPIMQGSAVTGVGHDAPHLPFDEGRHSDFDVALAGAAIYAKAEEAGLTKGGRTGPLSDEDIATMGLGALRAKMSRLAGGREVNFMIFESEEAAFAKSKASMAFPGGTC